MAKRQAVAGADSIEALTLQLESAAKKIRELVVLQPPKDLLGYLWSVFYMEAVQAQARDNRPNSDLIRRFQLVFEYVHAAWSCHNAPFVDSPLKEQEAKDLIEACDRLHDIFFFHCIASTANSSRTDFGDATQDMEFHAKSSWMLIRGHRYQVLEEEFFNFVLGPHDEALTEVFGMDSVGIAKGIQSIANSLRGGYSLAIGKLAEYRNQVATLEAEGLSADAAFARLSTENADIKGVFDDIFRGGICNLSRHTNLPESVLQELSFEPGSDTSFFADGPLSGTPYRTLPARIKPAVKLGDGYYTTDGQFVRDAAYRAIQRGLIRRKNSYRESWNQNQKRLIETAFPSILTAQLRDSDIFTEVYFRDSETGEWVETDLVISFGDVLLIVEAKAGVMTMHSPATDFDRHARTIRELVIKAYKQCKRFISYIANNTCAPIFCLDSGLYRQVGSITYKQYRRVVPIGLTVESYTPFSSMCKAIPDITLIQNTHPFISMSVDDLFVLNRFLPTSGQFFHYLEVRQEIAKLPKAMVFDEIDHLGAYVSRNRFDQDIRKHLEDADIVAWDSFCEVVDRFFERENWQTDVVPRQHYPPELNEILGMLDKARPNGWLQVDNSIRDLSGDAREELADLICKLRPTLKKFPFRRFLFGGNGPIQFWLIQSDARPDEKQITKNGELTCPHYRQA